MPQKPTENVHAGHRKRLLARFERDDFDSFEDHNILELLLFHTIPRADTNPAAHALINRFGSLYGVLSAPPEELQRTEGIGPASASFLHSVFEAAREADFRRITERPLFSYERLAAAAVAFFAGKTEETVVLFLLDDARRLAGTAVLAEGQNVCPVSYHDAILAQTGRFHTRNAVLLHNHPDGIMQPSGEDVALTSALYESLRACGIRLLEHLLVHEFDTLPILDRSVGYGASAYPLADAAPRS